MDQLLPLCVLLDNTIKYIPLTALNVQLHHEATYELVKNQSMQLAAFTCPWAGDNTDKRYIQLDNETTYHNWQVRLFTSV